VKTEKINILQFQNPFDKAIKEPNIIPERDKGSVRNLKAVIQGFIFI
jgi:hypothetical protein